MLHSLCKKGANSFFSPLIELSAKEVRNFITFSPLWCMHRKNDIKGTVILIKTHTDNFF